MSSFLYGIKQGIKNVFRNRLFSLASIGTITACLFIFGIFYCMVMNFQHIFSEVETTVGVTVFFDEGVEEDQILDIKYQIEKQDEVDNVHYTSSDEAWKEYKEKAFPDTDQNILTNLDNDNPLASSASLDDFSGFVSKMKEQGVRLVPIVDAGIKEEAGYSVCDEGKEKGYFCKRADGTDFEGTVWPGWSHFPDVLNPEARAWFGSQYKALTDCGIEGFWNDMNEPAIFYSREGLAERLDHPPVPHEDGTIDHFGQAIGWLNLSNAPEDYARFYHKVDGKMVRHDQVHNLYGYNMTRAASEGLASIAPGKRFLLFSRSSCIGMHRYGGVWTGDNHSWWSHLLLNLKMLPSLNMCGFLYVGADLGGFNADTSRDLLLRWLALGVFTPLMRNHSGCDTRRQEFYQFEGPEDFRSVIETRYRLIPYLYSEYMKAALNGDMLFKPLAFVYPEDEIALQTEDQLMLGNEVMIAPVYTQNATGRMVYLPEEMLFVKFGPEGRITQEVLPAGTHFVKVALNEVPLFIRKGACIPVADPAQTVAGIDPATIRMIGWPGASYDRYDDDGVTIPAE